MKHLKLFEEELTDWTKDLFDLYTIVKLTFLKKTLVLEDVTVNNVIDNLTSLLNKEGYRTYDLVIAKKLVRESINSIIVTFKIEGEIPTQKMDSIIPINETGINALPFNMNIHNDRLRLRYNKKIGVYKTDSFKFDLIP